MFLQDGNSVMAFVTDFLPYFYIAAPRGFTPDDLFPFKSYLNVSGIRRGQTPQEVNDFYQDCRPW
jgi:hypothetical protein